MGKKESNEVRMLGILPSQGADPIPVGKIPDGGTQILKSASANNLVNNIHTVGSGKTLYLSSVTLSLAFVGEVTGHGFLNIRDENDANDITMFGVGGTTNKGIAFSQSFCPPIEIPQLWDIYVQSTVSGLAASGFIHGYEA